MDFNSFDLDNTKEQSIQHSYSNDTESHDHDVADFFAFIDPTNFHSATTGLDQHNQRPPPSMESQLQSTHNAQIMANRSSLSNDTQTSMINNNTNNHSYPLMSPMHMNFNEYQTPLQQPMITDYPEDEEFFTPLISPAIPPNYYTNLRSDTNFSPLTSPALGPQNHNNNHHPQQGYTTNYFSTSNSMNAGNASQDGQSSEELQERLAIIERQQQQLRSHMQQSSSSPSLTSTSSPAIAVMASPLSSSSSPVQKSSSSSTYGSALSVNAPVTKPKQPTLRHQIAMSSPQFNPTTHIQSPKMHPSHHTHQNPTAIGNSSSGIGYQNASSSTTTNISPATPSLLMKLGNGMHQNANNRSGSSSNATNGNSPVTLSTTPSHDSIIDNMMSLPDAILPPSNSDATKKRITKKTAISMSSSTSSTKKRRISYPRSAFTPPALLPSSATTSSYQHADAMTTFDQGIAALVSPAALRPHTPSTSSSSSVLMSPSGGGNTLNSSPRALKPLISPSLQPNGKRLSTIDEREAAAILASKSNYQALREGRARSLGIDFNTSIQSGMENRRSAHKAAEQRRRDTLKQNFDALRMELLDALIREDELQRLDEEEEEAAQNKKDVAIDKDKVDTSTTEEECKQNLTTSISEREKKVKQMSKVVLLQHSYEYMLRLKAENQAKDAKLEKMTVEIRRLRTQCGMAPITEEERQDQAEEKRLEKEKRLARLKRLEDIVDS